MFLEERRRKTKILSIMDKNERVIINGLPIIFSISKETIRHDLSELSRKGLIERCHGGARIIRKLFQSNRIKSHHAGNKNNKHIKI